MTTLIERAPFPKEREKFASDNRVSYSQIAHAHVLKDERGEEWEWIERVEKWVSVVRTPGLLSTMSTSAGSSGLRPLPLYPWAAS